MRYRSLKGMIIKCAVTRDYFGKITTHSRFTQKLSLHMNQYYTIAIHLCINKRILRNPHCSFPALRVFIISRRYIFAILTSPLTPYIQNQQEKCFVLIILHSSAPFIDLNSIRRYLQLLCSVISQPCPATAHFAVISCDYAVIFRIQLHISTA